MSVSKRISISWSGGAPYEDSDVLVLTGRSYFIDMRVVKNSSPPVLDWAFAGTRSSKPGDNERETHCTWHHLVDSRSPNPAEDSGICRPDEHNPLSTIEDGVMLNPATGRHEPYQEIWEDEELPAGTEVSFSEKVDGTAFVAKVGSLSIGVGKNWAWRKDGDDLVYEFGEGERRDTVTTAEEGDSAGHNRQWIVRERWIT